MAQADNEVQRSGRKSWSRLPHSLCRKVHAFELFEEHAGACATCGDAMARPKRVTGDQVHPLQRITLPNQSHMALQNDIDPYASLVKLVLDGARHACVSTW